MKRRQLLKGAGLTAAVGVLGVATMAHRQDQPPDAEVRDLPEPRTTPEPPEQPTEQLADEYWTDVDAVEAGADPSGEEPINSFVQDHADDDTLLQFPGGTYKIEPGELTGASHLGIAASEEDRPSFVPAEDTCLGGGPYFHVRDLENFLLQGVDFDFRRDGSGGEIRLSPTGDATVRDVTIVGSCPDQIANFRFDVRDEDGTGLVENYRSINVQQDPSLTGVFVGRPHAGELSFRNCEVHGFSGNGIYASAPGLQGGSGGIVNIEDGTYQNNNIANIRLGTVDSSARGAAVRVDESPPEHVGVNARGIRLRNQSDQLIENCDLEFGENAGQSFGAIVFHPANGGALVRDTAIAIERDTVRAIRAFPPEEDPSSAPIFENVSISGGASLDHVVLIENRDGTTFRDCTIEQTGTDRGGVYLLECADCRIVDSRIDVTGEPLVLRNSDVQIENTTLVTPEGEEHIDERHAEDGDFVPRSDE